MTKDKKEYMKKYREAHREELNAYLREYGPKYHQANKEKIAEKRRNRKEDRYAYDRQERQALKLEVLGYYSNGIPKCAHCGISELVILCIDHINGGGVQERKKIKVGGGINFLRWLRSQKYPLGYQVLCYNCNARKTFSQYPAFKE